MEFTPNVVRKVKYNQIGFWGELIHYSGHKVKDPDNVHDSFRCLCGVQNIRNNVLLAPIAQCSLNVKKSLQ